MISINSVDHINLNVHNIEESLSFYNKFFDLSIKEEGLNSYGHPYKIIGKSNKLLLVLHENNGDLKNNRFNHFGIHVNNFEEVVNVLNEQNIPLLYGGINDYGESKSVYIADPDGNEIELSSKFGGGL